MMPPDKHSRLLGTGLVISLILPTLVIWAYFVLLNGGRMHSLWPLESVVKDL